MTVEDRALIWATGRDGALTRSFLVEAGFAAHACASSEDLGCEIKRGVGVIIVAGEMLVDKAAFGLQSLLAEQPAWSDIPLIVVAGREPPGGTFARLVETLGNVSLLHRPLSLDTLCSTVSAALRARRRQYQVRELLRQREETDRRREEFLAMLAHELRNPLAPIRTGLEVLRLTDSKEVASRMRGVIERQVGNLSRMIDDLLDVSRITRGKILLKREPLITADALRQVVDNHVRLAAEKGLKLELDVGAIDNVLIDADPTRFEQMIGNVLTNAIKFTPPKGSIRVQAQLESGAIVIRIKDTGIGIPRHMLRQVFELFTQTDRPLDRSQGGLGIGLTVVKTLAEMHGGSVEALSEGDQRGTEIVLRLPVMSGSVSTLRAQSTGTHCAAEQSRRVLLVEDNRDAADVLATYLRSHGHVVHLAYDGAAGMSVALRDRPDVVICDIGLPGVNGYDLARALRAAPDMKQCLLVAVSGYGEARDRERGLQAGFQYYFTKPANPEEIVRVLEPQAQQSAAHGIEARA